MGRTRVTPGMWRIDPKKRLLVIDRCGQTVASVQSENDVNLVAAAPDMFDLLEGLQAEGNSLSPALQDEIQLVLRRARGELGFAIFSNTFSRQRRNNQEWMRFIDRLVQPPDDSKK